MKRCVLRASGKRRPGILHCSVLAHQQPTATRSIAEIPQRVRWRADRRFSPGWGAAGICPAARGL